MVEAQGNAMAKLINCSWREMGRAYKRETGNIIVIGRIMKNLNGA